MIKVKLLFYIVLLLLIIQSCTVNLTKKNSDEIIITKEYLFRNTSEQKEKLGFYIEKITPIDKFKPPNNFIKVEGSKYTCSLEGIEGDTIFFNVKQKGVTWYSFKKKKQFDSFGSFEKNTWYHFIQLYKTYDYFVYVDSIGRLNQYRYSKSNW